jgi:predicted nucleic acid-binding protein
VLRKHSAIIADIFVSEALPEVVLPLDEQIALDAATISTRHQLAMADAIVYTTALPQKATRIASNGQFSGLVGSSASVICGGVEVLATSRASLDPSSARRYSS